MTKNAAVNDYCHVASQAKHMLKKPSTPDKTENQLLLRYPIIVRQEPAQNSRMYTGII